jgi:Tfp pilus assembly protein PilN
MRIELNLARDPFRNRTVFWLGMAAAFLVAFAALAVVVTRAAHRSADKAGLRDEIARQESTLKTLQSQIEEIQTVQGEAVFTDADRQALDDAREILNQRAFSWSRLLGELEPNVPAKARVTSIEISEVAGQGEGRVVTLAIAGRAKEFGQLAEFLANLDRTGGRFSADPVSNGPDADEGDYVFELRVRYRPALGGGGDV